MGSVDRTYESSVLATVHGHSDTNVPDWAGFGVDWRNGGGVSCWVVMEVERDSSDTQFTSPFYLKGLVRCWETGRTVRVRSVDQSI
jgi:hypothetical protein